MDLDDILNLNRLQCTGEVSRAGWVLDQDEILSAMDKLEIERTVHIRYMAGKWTYGTHRNKLDGNHYITVDQDKTLDSANFTLWHELVHCMQSERFVKENPTKHIQAFHIEYKMARGAHGQSYRGNMYELEANRLAAQNEETCLLAYTTS